MTDMVELMSDHATENKNQNSLICKVFEIWQVTTEYCIVKGVRLTFKNRASYI